MPSKLVRPLTPYDVQLEQWENLLAQYPNYLVGIVREGLFKRYQYPWENTSLSKALRERLKAELSPALEVAKRLDADDGTTTKWAFSLYDGAEIETVLMRYKHRNTICISSQAGCAMGCSFCATGQAGFSRNLSTGEILEQFAMVARELIQEGGTRPSNVVFMGMGEPLANYTNVISSIDTLNEHFGLGARSITLSTVGVIPGIEKLSLYDKQINLAVSLHAANDELRSSLIPLNNRYPIAKLRVALLKYYERTNRRISLEWAMMDEVNDTTKDALELVKLAIPLRAHVNLIPLNPTPNWPTRGSPPTRILAFQNQLENAGVTTTIRHNKGTDISAACGQLANANGSVGKGLPRRLSLSSSSLSHHDDNSHQLLG